MFVLRKYCLALLALLLVGCAYNTQTVLIDPDLRVVPAATVRGQPLSLVVIDDRDEAALGARGNAFGNTAAITTEQDLGPVLARSLGTAFESKGFHVAEHGPELRVILRSLRYRSRARAFGFVIRTSVTVTAQVWRDAMVFEQTYRGSREIEEFMTPTAARNTALVNEALSAALGDLVEDAALVREILAAR